MSETVDKSIAWDEIAKKNVIIVALKARVDELEKALGEICENAPVSEPDTGDYDTSNHGDSISYGINCQHFWLAKIARTALSLKADSNG